MVVFMVVLMDELMEATVALNCFTSFWVSRKLDCKVLKQVSRSWLRVWAMRMGELKRGGRGQNFCQKMIWMNVIREKRGIQWNRSQIMVKKIPDLLFFFFIFLSCGVILRSEEYCSDEIPKCLTRKKCVFTWKPKHSYVIIDLVCFNLFMFLSPKG
jgi:hypothetical protein